MSRAKNTASVQDVCKCLKVEVACLDPKDYLDVEIDQVCKHYRKFLGLMFQKTIRPSKDCLKEAALKVNPRTLSDEAKKWSPAIVECVQHIRTKAKWSISSKKYEPWMGELVKIYLECSEFHGNPAERQVCSESHCQAKAHETKFPCELHPTVACE